MKIDARRVAGFLRDPGACRVVLLHGEDSGLIHERAELLIAAVLGSSRDPFRFSELDRGMTARLDEEASALSLTGGRRVVRVREATEAAAVPVKAVLAGKAEALVILEAPGLSTRSKLHTLLERAPDGASIACYNEEGQSLERTIQSTLAGAKVTADTDAVVWLASQLGADRAATRQELEKLAVHAGAGGRVNVEMARACVGDLGGLSLEDALFSATEGEVAKADRAIELALSEGASAVGVLRAGLMHLQRLHRIAASIADGVPRENAIRAARPPVFFKRIGSVTRALGLWTPNALAAASMAWGEAEQACKRTGAPADALCKRAVLALAWRAAERRARSSPAE